ncbi:DUF3971 domain-containing protein [Phreatobacter sp.]|uniref:YhdP family protein n=1 Tax=Phreatobacter sp. TaxID=1966341 RepID=UPI0025FA44D4|nr:DUF3971 domain-containing protein [Phreatobacter sp.]
MIICPLLFLAWQIQRGGMGLDMVTPWIARSLSDQLGDGRTVTIGAAVIVRDGSGNVEIEARDVVVHDGDGRRVASMPRVALGLDSLPILGRPSIRRIDLVGASVALKVGEDGQIALAAGRFRTPIPEEGRVTEPPASGTPPAAEVNSTLPEPEMSPFRRLGIWLDLIEKSGLDGHRLAGFGLRNGTVIVDDVRSGKRFVFAGIDLDLTVPTTGGLSIELDASGSGARWTSTAIVTPRDAAGRRVIDLSMRDMAPRDLSLALQGPQVVFADTPISGTLRATVGDDGDPVAFNGRVTMGAGKVGDVNDEALRVAIDSVAADVHWDTLAPGLVVDRVEVVAGDNRASLNGVVIPPARSGEPFVVELKALRAVTSVLNPHEPPVPINVSGARFVFEPATRTLALGGMTVDQGAETLARIAGKLTFAEGSPAVELDVTAGRMPLATALSLWPRASNPHARDWVADNMRGGTTDDTAIRMAIPAGLLASKHWVLEKDALSVRSKLRGTSLRVMPGMSPLKDADLDLDVDGQMASLTVERGSVEPAVGQRLILTQGTFEILDHRIQPLQSVTKFRLQGSASAAFALLGEQAFKGAATGPTLPTGKVEGMVTAQVTVNVPLTDTFQANLIDYAVDADFTGFSADNAFGEMRVERAAFKVQTTPRSLTMRGQGVLGGAQANFEYRKPRPDAKPEIRLTATLDDRGRSRLGLNIGPRIVGPTPVRVMTVGEDSGRYNVEVDLGPATLADLLPGWSKPRGQPAKARFVAVEGDDGWKLEDLVVESRGVLVRGSATFDDKGGLIAGVFPAYNLSDGDRVNIRIERAGSGHRVIGRGEMIDARHLIKSLSEPARPGALAPATAATEVDIDFKANAVVGGNGEVIRQFEMRMVRQGQTIRSLSASGRVGRDAPFAIEQRGQGNAQRLAVSSGDAGALLRFLDIYRALQGGTLALIMTPPQPNGTIREGSVEITDFRIRGDQAISGMVAAAGTGPNAPRQQQNDAFAFSRLRANFARAASKVTVSDGLLWGAAIGATVEGEFDPGRDRLMLRGTYVPAYALNNIFARIPVLGFFLGGAPDEGVFGITYQIAGAVSAPRLTINPLSAVTPGFLRKMFEFRGASSTPPPMPGDAAQR